MATEFGRDISCTTSLRTGRTSTGARLVGEAAYRRLTTPRGMLRGGEEEANYGLDLTALVGSAAARVDLASLPGRIRAELVKDERIESADVAVDEVTEGGLTRVTVQIEAYTSEGPFILQIGVDEVSTELIGLTAEG